MLSWLKFERFQKQEKYTKHYLFDDLKRAIENNNHTLVKCFLQEVSLLRMHKLDVNDSEYVAYIKSISAAKSPQIIYEILAAGFPVVDMLIGLHENGKTQNILSCYMLMAMLPGISQVEHNQLTSSFDHNISEFSAQLNRCIVGHDIPRVPIKFENLYCNFASVIDGLFGTDYKLNLGYRNTPLIHNIDDMVLDLDYIAQARKNVNDNISKRDLGVNADNPFFNKNFAHEIAPIIETLRGVKSSSWNDINYFLAFVVVAVATLIVSIMNSMYGTIKYITDQILGSSDDLESIDSLKCKNYYYDSTQANLKFTFFYIFIALCSLIAVNKFRQRIDLSSNNWNVDYYDLINLGKVVKYSWDYISLNKVHQIIDTLVLAKEFDFEKARDKLPGEIASRFKNEYLESKSPALRFWKQAFEKHSQPNSARETNITDTRLNTPVFSLNAS